MAWVEKIGPKEVRDEIRSFIGRGILTDRLEVDEVALKLREHTLKGSQIPRAIRASELLRILLPYGNRSTFLSIGKDLACLSHVDEITLNGASMVYQLGDIDDIKLIIVKGGTEVCMSRAIDYISSPQVVGALLPSMALANAYFLVDLLINFSREVYDINIPDALNRYVMVLPPREKERLAEYIERFIDSMATGPRERIKRILNYM